MSTYTLVVAQKDKDIFDMIRSGQKKVETRAYTVKYHEITAGDMLIFSCDGEKFEKNIAKVTHFKTIPDVFKVYAPDTIHPGIGSEEALIAKWHSFTGYKEKIAENGLLAFELE